MTTSAPSASAFCQNGAYSGSESSRPATLVKTSAPFMPSEVMQRSSSRAASAPSLSGTGAERDEPVRLARHVLRQPVVYHLRGFDRDIERHRVVALVRRRP